MEIRQMLLRVMLGLSVVVGVLIDPLATLVLAFAFMFGLLSRMCGGMPPKLPWGLDQHLYALPYAALAAMTAHIAGAWPWLTVLAFLFAYATAFLGKRTGHGRGMSLNAPMKPGSEPERVEALIIAYIDIIPTYWYKVLILLLTGVLVPLGAAIVLAVAGWYVMALVLLVSGAAKAFGYMVGWWVFPKGSDSTPNDSEIDEATEVGEGLTGFFGGLGLGACALAILLSYILGAFNG